MKILNQGILLLSLSLSGLSFADTNQISGKIFRISYEPTGAFLSIQNEAGELITFDAENCGKDNVFHLPTDHLNFKVMSAMLYSHHNNNRGVSLIFSGCRFQVPVITSVEKIFNH